METVKQLTIVPETELKAMEVPPISPESWAWKQKKEKALFPGAIKRILYREEIDHLSDKKGARHVDQPMEYLLYQKVVKTLGSYTSGLNVRGNAFVLLRYVFEQKFIPDLHFDTAESIATGCNKVGAMVLYVNVKNKGRQTVLFSKLTEPWC